MLTKTKIYLSSPHMGGSEQHYVNDAFDSNWIAPLGPHVDGFEKAIETYLDEDVYVAVLSSGTASLHLALQLLNVGQGDEVLCQSFTFSASANPIIYQGASPIFVDSESDTWNMSPELLEKERAIYVAQAADSGKPPEIVEKMVEGRVRKFVAESSLVEQPFVKDPDLKVSQLLKNAGADVVGFVRFEVGEGIEKDEVDFASEVAAQVQQSS